METPPHLVKFVKLWKKYGNNYLVLNENCARHIWKRMGSDLRNYKRNAKEKLSYEGTVGGGGKFTEEVIDNFQNYHGTPIRDNKNAVLKMKDANGLFIKTAFYVRIRQCQSNITSVLKVVLHGVDINVTK